MVNKKEKILEDIGYKKKIKKKKEEKATGTGDVKVNSSSDKNSQLRGY